MLISVQPINNKNDYSMFPKNARTTIPPTANAAPRQARGVGLLFWSFCIIYVNGRAYKGPTEPSVNARAKAISKRA